MMKTKRLYQSPWTRRDEVELEDGFCGSIMEGKDNAVEIEGHTVGNDYDFATGKDAEGNGGFSVTWE
ncbi:MAG: hypothetical protein IKL03_03635 [Bacteroidaceae bacterium]|nr:hypothetical protein [Bacteroidaceae bacterium]